MAGLFRFSGDDDFFPGGSMCLSSGSQIDVYYPLCKRSRIATPSIFSGFEKKQASIEELPDECLFEILRRLPSGQERSICAGVSKRWLSLLSNMRKAEVNVNASKDGSQEIEGDGYLSRSLEGNKATDIRLAAISVGTASRGGLGKLLIRGSGYTSKVSDVGLQAIAHGCPSLKVLSLWKLSSVGDLGLCEIARSCPLLEKLDLTHCPGVTDKGLIAIAENCRNLVDLTIDSCSGLGNEGLKAIARCCGNLRSVSIRNCPRIGDQGVAFLLAQAGCYLRKVKLQMLNLTGTSLAVLGHYGTSVTDLVLNGLRGVSEKGFWVMGNAKGLKKLKSVSVMSCQGMTDSALEALGNGCPDLKHLLLSKCWLVSGNGLISFAKSVSSLESLRLEECHRINHFGFFGFLLHCGLKLRTFSVTNCLGINEANPGGPSLPLTHCISLRSLSIHSCPGIGDSSLAILGTFCHNLQEVELCRLNAVTDAGLLNLLQRNTAGLVKINLNGCFNVSDNAVSAIVMQHGHSLESLFLDGCKITDATLIAVAKFCYSINDLDVSNSSVSDIGIQALASSPNHMNIQIISISGCSAVTNKVRASILKLGRTLLGLNIQRCTKISSSTIDTLLQHLWRCDILY